MEIYYSRQNSSEYIVSRLTCLLAMSSSSPPQPQKLLENPFTFLNCCVVSDETPPKIVLYGNLKENKTRIRDPLKSSNVKPYHIMQTTEEYATLSLQQQKSSKHLTDGLKSNFIYKSTALQRVNTLSLCCHSKVLTLL